MHMTHCPHCGEQLEPEVKRPGGCIDAVLGAWVPCAQRLPPHKEFVLAFGPNLGDYVGGPTISICRFDGDLWVEGGTELANSDQRMTHWMPLPSPPVSD